MADNINKVVFGGRTIIDISSDTVTPKTLMAGVTAHDSAGYPITGVYEPPEPVSNADLYGYFTDPATDQLVVGMVTGDNLSFTGETMEYQGRTYNELSSGQTFMIHTVSGYQVWRDGVKVSWLDPDSGELVSIDQVVQNRIQLGDWEMSIDNGFGIKYIGG